MEKKIKVVEFFSGIGSQAKALKNLGYEVETKGTCEWDVQSLTAYDLIHNGFSIVPDVDKMSKDEILAQLNKYNLSFDGKKPLAKKSLNNIENYNLKMILSAIIKTKNMVDINSVNGNTMPNDIDILTYSFPCQDLSNVGAFHGYNKGIDKNSGSRSSLLWEVGRILKEIKDAEKKLPRYLLMENVPTLLSKRHFSNFNIWIDDLNKMGYVSKYFPLNSRFFGLPQNRPRLLMLSVYVGENKKKKTKVEKYFDDLTVDKIISDYKKSKYYRQYSINQLLRIDYNNDILWNEAIECVPNDTPSRRRIWENNPVIVEKNNKLTDLKFIRTITTKQDRDPNSGNLYINTGDRKKSKFRYLTPRECMLFMGFEDRDYEVLKANSRKYKNTVFFNRDKVIRLAGNSIPVKMLEGIFYQIKFIDDILITNKNYGKANKRDKKIQ